MSTSASKEPFLVRRRVRENRCIEPPTMDEIMPYAVSRTGVLSAATKETRVDKETTDDA
jgi:hypothetical protein